MYTYDIIEFWSSKSELLIGCFKILSDVNSVDRANNWPKNCLKDFSQGVYKLSTVCSHNYNHSNVWIIIIPWLTLVSGTSWKLHLLHTVYFWNPSQKHGQMCSWLNMFTQLKAAHSFLNLEALGAALTCVSLHTERQIVVLWKW